MAFLEHVNLTVPDPEATAARLQRLFGWRTRWQGPSIHGGHTVHVGTEDQYLAHYSGQGALSGPGDSYATAGALNHVAVVVADLDATEARVRAEGIETHSHADYEPGRRFYFRDPDGVEYEIVSYA